MQEVYRIIPYTSVLKTIDLSIHNEENSIDDIDDISIVKSIEELDLSLPIDNVDDYL